MNSGLLLSRLNAPGADEDRVKAGRAGVILGAFIGALVACALILPAPAMAATSCSTPGHTLHVAPKANLDVVGLSAQGFPCTKAIAVAREVARDLAAGSSISLSGAAGIDITSTTPCAGCATETHVSLSYPTGTINVSLKGATRLSSSGGAMFPSPALPFPRIPDFPFPNIPSFPAPTIPNSGITTV